VTTQTLPIPTVQFGRIIDVWQITEGAATCQQCAEDAVLFVSTEPDGDPGYSCWEHAEPWLTLTDKLVRDLFGPKVISA
jgi:hypothetical protein